MGRAALLMAVLANALSFFLLWEAWGQQRSLELPPIPLRGADLAGSLQEAEPQEPPPLFAENGELQLAALGLPEYDAPELRADPRPFDGERMPAPIAALDGREVTVRGYPLPYESRAGAVSAVLLSKNPPGCCFGSRPALDEWIEVRAKTPWRGLDPASLVTFRGTLRVGEVQDEDGYALSLYRLEEPSLDGG